MINQDGTAKLLASVDDLIAAHRAFGHEWPSRKLLSRRRGTGMPAGFVPRKQRDGSTLITETCPCGKKRWWVSPSGAIFGPGTVRRYIDPDNWERFEQGTVTPRTFQQEVYRRAEEDIAAAAGEPGEDDG